VYAAHCVGLEHRVLEIRRLHVLREEFDRAQLLLHRLLYPFGSIRELPVGRHEVHAEQLLRADHVRAPSPERGRRALPVVAAVEQQRVRPRGAQALYQRRKMGIAADFAVAARRFHEVEVGEGVRQGGLLLY
jgi:hypothetical protein